MTGFRRYTGQLVIAVEEGFGNFGDCGSRSPACRSCQSSDPVWFQLRVRRGPTAGRVRNSRGESIAIIDHRQVRAQRRFLASGGRPSQLPSLKSP